MHAAIKREIKMLQTLLITFTSLPCYLHNISLMQPITSTRLVVQNAQLLRRRPHGSTVLRCSTRIQLPLLMHIISQDNDLARHVTMCHRLEICGFRVRSICS